MSNKCTYGFYTCANSAQVSFCSECDGGNNYEEGYYISGLQSNTMAKATKKTEVKRDAPTPVRIPEDLKAKALKRAEEENRTLSNLIITALKQYLK